MNALLHWQPERPYDLLPPLPPASDIETKIVLKQCITARSALAELKQAVQLIPNPAMLINTLPLLEAPPLPVGASEAEALREARALREPLLLPLGEPAALAPYAPQSNFSTACIRPRLPSWIRSSSGRPDA